MTEVSFARRSSARILLLCLVVIALCFGRPGWAQQIQGTVNVQVVDASGAVLPAAQLKLVENATNDTRSKQSLGDGSYSFIHLRIGEYTLTVSKEGFKTQVYNLEVQAARTTDVTASLEVGKVDQVVEVKGNITPLVEATSNAINMTITPDMIQDLPLSGRNVSGMSHLAAGYNGTWNGLPTTAQSSSVDGVVGSSGRWKYYAGADSTAVQPRLESISEMTVATDQLDMSQGFGTSTMTITYATKHGSNEFHGQLFEDLRNTDLNAKTWSLSKSAKKNVIIRNEFGGNLAGPIIKDKLFFFGNFSMMKQPNSYSTTNAYFTDAAQAGEYKWYDANGAVQSTDLWSVITSYNKANNAALGASVNADVAAQIAKINGYVKNGAPQNIGSDDMNIAGLTWNTKEPITQYFPAARVDYNLSQRHRLYMSFNQTKSNTPNSSASWWPGDKKTADSSSNGYTIALGFESTITQTLVNQLKLGYLYSAAAYTSPDTSYRDTGAETVAWGYSSYNMSGQSYNLPTSRMQPVGNLSDDVTWIKGKHNALFGITMYRDTNKYWDAPTGVPTVTLGFSDIDPAVKALTKANVASASGTSASDVTDTALSGLRSFYATMNGRVSYIYKQATLDVKTGQYSNSGFLYNRLNELMKSWGWYAQDSFKILPNLTLNYGIRWDFTGPNRDQEDKYHSMSTADLFGPSGSWNLFKPGTLSGTNDPMAVTGRDPYKSWNVSPQPAFGVAWAPRDNATAIERLLGGSKTVIRAGFQLRRFTEPQQFVWDAGSNYSTGLFQDRWAQPDTSGAVGTFQPGSMHLGDAFPEMAVSPSAYAKKIHMSEYTFGGSAYTALEDNIRQPYTESWNFGLQREIGLGRAIEVRYVGNRTVHQWLSNNVNEINIFENGFLKEFEAAQANLAAGDGTSFGYSTGGNHLPVMEASGVDFTNPDFITMLQHGNVGAMASQLSNTMSYYCTMVGASFGPCKTNGYTGGASEPINYWLANPYALGSWTGAKLVTDQGFSTYNSLQIEARQRDWYGLDFDVNYTWSKTLGTASSGDWTGGYNQFTIRNMRSAYVPASTDLHHVIHANATYELPFGKGRFFLNNNALLDKIVGGWSIGTIYTFQTGAPFRIAGLYNTYNDLNDGGVKLNGISAKDIQKHVGVHYVPGSNSNVAATPYFLPTDYAKSLLTGKKITANTTPGTMAQKLWLWGPHQSFDDFSINKSVTVFGKMKGKLQCEMINALNHPTFKPSSYSIDNAGSFGQGYSSGSPRVIEIRANVEF